jgi:hypothetical protein
MAYSDAPLTVLRNLRYDRHRTSGPNFALTWSGIHRLLSGYGPDVAANCERWLPKRTEERAPHSLTIGKARLAHDNLDGMLPLFDQQSRSFNAKLLYGFGRRLTGFGHERSGELPGAQIGSICEILDRQPLV